MTTDTTMTDVDTSSEAMERMCTAMRLEFPPSVADHIQERVRALAAERDELSMKLNEAAHTAKAALDRCDELERLAGAVREAGENLSAYAFIAEANEVSGNAKKRLAEFDDAVAALTDYQRKGE